MGQYETHLTALKGRKCINVCKLGLASKKFVKIKFITKEQYGGNYWQKI